MKAFILTTAKQARRLIVGVVGFTVLLIGVVMIVLPGPAMLVIPLGFAILATEFVWAKKLLKRVRSKIQENRKGGKASET